MDFKYSSEIARLLLHEYGHANVIRYIVTQGLKKGAQPGGKFTKFDLARVLLSFQPD